MVTAELDNHRSCFDKNIMARALQIYPSWKGFIFETFITEINCQRKNHKTWTIDDTLQLMIERLWYGPRNRLHYYERTAGFMFEEAYDLDCLLPTFKHGSDSIIIWAAISWLDDCK